MESAYRTVNGSYKSSNDATVCEHPALLQSANHESEVRLRRRQTSMSDFAQMFNSSKARWPNMPW